METCLCCCLCVFSDGKRQRRTEDYLIFARSSSQSGFIDEHLFSSDTEREASRIWLSQVFKTQHRNIDLLLNVIKNCFSVYDKV